MSNKNIHLNQIVVVLVEPQSPGNIGSVCRAMTNMGISNLRLVNPPEDFRQHDEAIAFAMFARELLNRACCFPSLESALNDLTQTVALTRRVRRNYTGDGFVDAQLPPLLNQIGNGRLGFVFGREDKGLYNHEVDSCHFRMQLRVSEQGSLSLPAAVTLTLYDCFRCLDKTVEQDKERRLSIVEQQELVHDMESLLTELDFYGKDTPERTRFYLRMILGKASLNTVDGKWLRKFINHIRRLVNNPN